jgi:DNA-binding transcriptional regulator YiaG
MGNTVTSNLANTNTQTANDALVNAAANNAAAAALANNAAALAAANNQTITDADIVAATLATGQTVEQIRAAYELAQAQFEASLAALAVAFNGTAAALPSAPAPVATQNAGVAVAGVNDFNSGVPIVPILP